MRVSETLNEVEWQQSTQIVINIIMKIGLKRDILGSFTFQVHINELLMSSH